MNFGNVFSYLFQLILARNFSPDDFGIFNSVNSLAIVIAAPVSVIPFIISRYTVQLLPKGLGQVRYFVDQTLKLILALSVVLLIAGTLMVPVIMKFLNLDSKLPIVLMLGILVISLILPVFLGFLQGLSRYTQFGMSSSAVLFFRCIGAVILVWYLGTGVTGALLAVLSGILLATLIAMYAMKDIFSTPKTTEPEILAANILKFAFPTLITLSSMMLFGNLDIVLVRHYVTGDEAGLYSTAAILGKIALFLPSVLLVVLFPEAAKLNDQKNSDMKILWISVAMTASIGGGFALTCRLFPQLIITLLFGEQYIAAAEMLYTVSFAMAALAISNVIFTFNLAHHNYGFIFILLGGLSGFLVTVFFIHDSALVMAKILLWAASSVLVISMSWQFGMIMRRKSNDSSLGSTNSR